MLGAPNSSSSLKEYLKKYQSSDTEENKEKKKKKKVKSTGTGVLVVDGDPIWQKTVTLDEEDNDSDEEKPLVEEDIEVKRMKRLELLRSKRSIGAISEDGSGWVSISDAPRSSHSTEKISKISPLQRKSTDLPSPELDLKPTTGPDLDLSPPRKRRARNDTPSPEHDLKPTSKQDIDLSPPRKGKTRNDTPSLGPEPKSHSSVADANSFQSRRGKVQYDSPSPERKSRSSRAAAAGLSLPRQKQMHFSSRRVRQDDSHTCRTADLSPPRKDRKNRSASSDLSARQASQFLDENNVALESSGLDLSPPRKTQKNLSAPSRRLKTGLVTGEDVKEEIAKTRKEDLQRFKEMDPSISGRGAEPVYRDKMTGDRLSKDQYLKLQKKDEKPKEVKLEWGKGLAQKREAEARLQELESERAKPFSRSRDDPELEKMLKERIRWGDPMAHLVKKKRLEPVLEDLGDNEKMKESGFVIPQEIPSHSWIRRGLHAPPNRYGIKPGRHWDGVDRSNGFETETFKRMNEKQATEREAYLWSVADM